MSNESVDLPLAARRAAPSPSARPDAAARASAHTRPRPASSSAGRPRRTPAGAVAPTLVRALGLCLLGGVAAAQTGGSERFLVSTTNDAGALDPALPVLTDTDLLVVGSAALPAPWYTEGHWRALADFAPRDVDGATTMFGAPRAGDLYVTFLSDDGGFRDGDVLRLDADGVWRVAVPEDLVAAALGDPGLALDLDAIAFAGASPGGSGPFGGGRLVFSLDADVDTPALGPVANGDVLALDEQGGVVRLFSEGEVEDALALATGSAAAVGDVHAVCVVGDEVWVAVQSPSEYDGAVLALGGLARLVADEVDLGLGGEELDALVHLPDETPLCLWLEATVGDPNGRGAVQHGTAGGPVLLLGGGTPGWLPLPGLGGFGGLALDQGDPILTALLAGPQLPVRFLDATGSLSTPVALDGTGAQPGPGGAPGLTLQAVDLASGRVSAPFRVL